LDNTLAKPDEDAEMEWPIIGLDKQLIGFTPWLIIRQRILEKVWGKKTVNILSQNFIKLNRY
jgi:hypothetical protein